MTTQEMRIQKLKEYAEREDQKAREEQEQIAELKEIYKRQQARKNAPKVDKYEGMTMKEIYEMQQAKRK